MALAILDGTQTATTLSTILSSGQHITAHTVVSLGTQAKTDILSAVSSGIAISGTVTANAGANFAGEIYNGIFNFSENDQMGVYVTDPLPTGTNSIGRVTVAGTVTIGAGTAQIGSVTASNLTSALAVYTGGNSDISVNIKSVGGQSFIQGQTYVPVAITEGSLPAGTNSIGVVTVGAGTVTIGAGTAQIGSVTASISGTVPISISSVTVGNSVTIGSLPAISGTVTANIAISSTAITSGSFSSLTSATLVPSNTARKMATVYNLGAGQLFVNAGATATTLGGGFMVALSSGDFYECDYTTTTLSAIFATAGTASWVSH